MAKTDSFRGRWESFISQEPQHPLGGEDVIKLIAPFARPERICGQLTETWVGQTGYCYTSIPRTIVYAGDLPWLRMANDSPHVSCIITKPAVLDIFPDELKNAVITYANADEAFHYLHNQAIHERAYGSNGAHAAFIAPSAQVHETALIRGLVVIDHNVQIGPHTLITGPAYIGAETRIEEFCTIGSRGLFAKKIAGRLAAFNFYGGVVIGSNCHIHARANIARSPHFRMFTTVEDDVSVGIFGNVGHDCVIRKNSVIASTACVCGRGQIGPGAWIGAGAIISEGLRVEENARVQIGAVVINNVGVGAVVSGNFARNHGETLRSLMKGPQ